MSNLKARDKMRFTVNMLGFKKTYDMTPEDIVRNVAYNMAGLYENDYLDGYRDEPVSEEEFSHEVYDAMMRDHIEMFDDGSGWIMPTPKEVRFLGRAGIEKIACEVLRAY
jgi:hypothetical protein